MAFFTDDEIANLRIENMILHVVSDEEFNPQSMQIVEHADFFIERIRDTDVDPIFAFDPNSHTKQRLEQIASGEDGFESGCQGLSREFARLHPGSSRDGAFFIFELATADEDVRIYSLIKYDYQQVIEQQIKDGANLLRLIVQAFVADKRAIQKAALVRVVKGVAQTGVAARDRMKQAPDIGDYFASYLHVTRTRNDRQLNEKAVIAVSGALKELKDLLPDRDVPAALRRAKASLGDRQRINAATIEEAILAAAGNPEDEQSITKIQKCVRRKVKSAKLEGLDFVPDRQLLRIPAIRRLRTTEGVLLFYPDRVGDTNVTRKIQKNGGEVITITTRRIEEDGIVRQEPRSAS